VLDGIEANGAVRNGVTHGRHHVLNPECFLQAQHLHELALALLAHVRFEQAAQGGELFRQLPADQDMP
jgi:hypothetical protein